MNSSSLITLPADLDFRTWSADALERAAQEEEGEARRLNRPRAVPAPPRGISDPGPLWHPTPVPFTGWNAAEVWRLRQLVGSWGLRLPRIVVGCVNPADTHHVGSTRLDIDGLGLHIGIRLHARLSVTAFPGIVAHELRHAWQLSHRMLSGAAGEEDADEFAARILALQPHQIRGGHALEPAWR